MQAIKDKINDIKTMRKAKADAKAEEKAEKEFTKARLDIRMTLGVLSTLSSAEKEFTKARLDVVHEMRLAKEAEASMDLHVAKASQKVDREIAKLGGLDSGYDPNIEGGDPSLIGIDPNPSAPASRPSDPHEHLTTGFQQNC